MPAIYAHLRFGDEVAKTLPPIYTALIEKYPEAFALGTQGPDILFYHKPFKKNFMKACEKMGIEPEKTLVIGDSLWCDIFGGKRNQMKTALVKDVEEQK